MGAYTYVGTNYKPAALPAGVLDEWEDTLKNERLRILTSLNAKVPEGTFVTRLATPSSDQYALFLKTCNAPWDRDKIVMKQKIKLAIKETDWRTGITNAFAEGGTFVTNVHNKRDKYKLARYVLGMVGHKPTVGGDYGVWNPISFGILLMRGDKRPLTYKDANDTCTPNWGAVQACLDVTKGKLVTPSVIAHAVYGCMMAEYMYQAGLEADIQTWLNTAVTGVNAVLADLVDLAIGAGIATVIYRIDWDSINHVSKISAGCTL